jgi:hypothetical protein
VASSLRDSSELSSIGRTSGLRPAWFRLNLERQRESALRRDIFLVTVIELHPEPCPRSIDAPNTLQETCTVIIRTATILSATLALLSFSVRAETTYVEVEKRFTPAQMHETGLDRLTPKELESLNGLLRGDVEAAVAAATESSAEARPSRSNIGLDDGPIHGRLKGRVEGWEPGTVFELENGQQWKVLKGTVKLRKALDAPDIVVVPGIAGRWFLQVEEDMPKARVYRID